MPTIRDDLLPARFWNKVQPDASGCWLWTACLNQAGYGVLNVAGTPRRAHRLSYEALVGPIPESLTIDHLCRTKRCVNPEHMEPVTRAENTRREASNALRDSCRRGHVFGKDGRVTWGKDRRVMCRACARVAKEKLRAKGSDR